MNNLLPRPFWSLHNFPGMWDEDEDWFSSSTSNSGLSVSEDDNRVYVEASVAGVKPEDVKVTFHKGVLWIKAKREEKEEDKKKHFYREANYDYQYRVMVPGNIDSSQQPKAKYENGVMKVEFTKVPEEQPKEIPVES